MATPDVRDIREGLLRPVEQASRRLHWEGVIMFHDARRRPCKTVSGNASLPSSAMPSIAGGVEACRASRTRIGQLLHKPPNEIGIGDAEYVPEGCAGTASQSHGSKLRRRHDASIADWPGLG